MHGQFVGKGRDLLRNRSNPFSVIHEELLSERQNQSHNDNMTPQERGLFEIHAKSSHRDVVYPRTFSTDVDGVRLLAIFGETGLFGGLATSSCPRESQENCAVPEGKSPHFPR